jgi:glycosyltransferase involved in cell wall biosynthesis
MCRFVPIPSGPLERWRALHQATESDVVVLQKKTSLHPWDLAQLRRANANLAFDFDDAVMFHEIEHGDSLSGKHFGKFLRTVRAARHVVAGNGFLARFARDAGCDVTVLPTPIDPGRYRIGTAVNVRKPGFVVGWLGVSQNQKYLLPLRGAFRALRQRFPHLTVKVVSEKFPVDLDVPMERKLWRLEDEPADIASFDVGIMPLPDNLWAWGKCGYKLIQYLASGVPVVASPVGLNLDIVREGRNGIFASEPEEWEARIGMLLADPEKAREMGRWGAEDAERRYSIRSYAEAYFDVFRETLGRGGESGER